MTAIEASRVATGGARRDTVPGADPPASARDPRHVAERVAALLEEIRATGDTRVAERAEDLVAELMQLYGAGLRRLLQLVDEGGALDDRLIERLVDDQLVTTLLILHDLHPLDVEQRVARAIDKVRPYLGSHGGGVEVIAIEDDIVRLRMEGSCSGCPSSAVTINFALERAILDAAPEIARVEAVEEPAAPTLIQLRPIRHMAHPDQGHQPIRPPGVPARSEWVTVDAVAALGSGDLAHVDLAGSDVLLVRAGGELYAYGNRCPACGAGLGDGTLSSAVLTCPTCDSRYDVRVAGRGLDGAVGHLDPLPLLADDGGVRIAVPVGA